MSMTTAAPPLGASEANKPWYKVLYIQVLIAIVIGVLVGWLEPKFATMTGSRPSATVSSS
jgi:aerobic C4-dicarboxylate transport protein